MKKKLLLPVCALLLLTVLLSSCAIKGEPPEDTALQQGNAPATGQKRDESTSSLETTQETAHDTTQQSTTNKKGPFKTFTGLEPLPERNFNDSDINNQRGLSTASVSYTFGVAKNALPHPNSLNAQKYFNEKKFNAVSVDTKTKGKKVLYLTFDCGWENGYTNKVLDVLKSKSVPAAFFCTLSNIKKEPQLIARMINDGHIVGNHSTTHPNFSRISRDKMAQEILMCDNYLRQKFGYTSPFFRFPEGGYSDCALDLVSQMGFKSVFWSVAYADWDVNNQKGADYAFDIVTERLHPGAIILLHSVSPDNAAALPRIIDWARQNGYEFKSLSELPK